MTTTHSQDRSECGACGQIALVGDRRCTGCGRVRFTEIRWYLVGAVGLCASIVLMLVTN